MRAASHSPAVSLSLSHFVSACVNGVWGLAMLSVWSRRGRYETDGARRSMKRAHLNIVQQPFADSGCPLAQCTLQLHQQSVQRRLLISIRCLHPDPRRALCVDNGWMGRDGMGGHWMGWMGRMEPRAQGGLAAACQRRSWRGFKVTSGELSRVEGPCSGVRAPTCGCSPPVRILEQCTSSVQSPQ